MLYTHDASPKQVVIFMTAMMVRYVLHGMLAFTISTQPLPIPNAV